MSKESFGFFICRSVTKPEHNNIWKQCYKGIRKFYNEKIIIIDSSSIEDIVDNSFEVVNTIVIHSEYKGSSVLVPYYYFYKLKPFDKAIMLQDSMIINKFYDFSSYNLVDVVFLWSFGDASPGCLTHYKDYELELVQTLNNTYLTQLYLSLNWKGCFGGSSFIKYEFLSQLVEKYDIFKMLPYLAKKPEYRNSFERIFAVLCWSLSDTIKYRHSLFDDIHTPLNKISTIICNYDINNLDNICSDTHIIKLMVGR